MEQLIDLAKKAGAEHVEVQHAYGTSHDIEILDGSLEKSEQTTSDAVGIRVVIGSKQATAKTENLSGAGLKRLAEQVVAMAKASPDRDDIVMNHTVPEAVPALTLADDSAPTGQALTDLATAAENALHDVKSGGFWASASRSTGVFLTSHGHHLTSESTMYSLGGQAVAGDTDMTQAYSYHTTRRLADLKDPNTIGTEAAKKALAKQGHISKNLGNVPVLFDREVSGRLVAELLNAINGSAVASGDSFLKDALGEQLFGDHITIVDDPLMAGGLATRAFDGEGFVPEKLNLIDGGILTDFLLDLRTAKKLGKTSNHRASRALGSLPGPSSTNTYLMAGEKSRSELIESMDTGVVITGLIGRGGSLNSGEYSIGAEGFLVEGGRITQPLAGITLGGHLRDIFKTMIPAQDLIFEHAVNAPSIFVPSLTVAGK